MKKWLLCLVLCVGCGSSNPVTPEPEAPVELTFQHATLEEVDAYLGEINQAFTSIDVFFAEYAGVSVEVTGGLVTTYWSRQFTQNMISRIHSIQANLHDIRPQNPYLRKLHIEEFEGAFEDYLAGAIFMEQNLDFVTTDVLDGINSHMGAGNVHIIRLQIFLSDLTGFQVSFGGNPPGDGQTFGF